MKWITEALTGAKPLSDFDSALGRLSFVCGTIIFDRLFLAPLYSRHDPSEIWGQGGRIAATGLRQNQSAPINEKVVEEKRD